MAQEKVHLLLVRLSLARPRCSRAGNCSAITRPCDVAYGYDSLLNIRYALQLEHSAVPYSFRYILLYSPSLTYRSSGSSEASVSACSTDSRISAP
ncbi:hypothetical protein OR1_03303 [Geobacter sp. OR-1]|nr:hypothetical protein OR1_03303 [Geobacter sp. OR-1]